MRVFNYLYQPKIGGRLGMIATVFFGLAIVILGLITPNYNHFENTISYMILGKYRPAVSFLLLCFALITVYLGLSLKKTLKADSGSKIQRIFLFFAFSIVALVLVPTDPKLNYQIHALPTASLSGKAHFLIAVSALITSPWLVISIIRSLREDPYWHDYCWFTAFVFLLDMIILSFWFVAFFFGIGFYWKGLWQKTMLFVVLIWYFFMFKKLSCLKKW
jgi:hypothetical protein